MGINYEKYINSTGTHYISNSGSDENGKYHGGKAGDQTGREWRLRSWYNRPWSCVLRHPDPRVRRLIAEFGIEAALNDLIGYDQHQRTTFWAALQAAAGYRPANITVACEDDCTAGVAAIVKAIGYVLGIAGLRGVSIDAYSGNLKSVLMAAGFEVLTASKYLTGHAYLLPGDVLLYEGHHAAINITRGKKAVGEVAEHVDAGSGAPAGDSCLTIGRILKRGMSGADVRELQATLVALGYGCGPDGADGDYGTNTVAAVKKFQKDKGLLVDGEAGPDTIGALVAALAAQKPAADESETQATPTSPTQPANGKRVVISGCTSANIRTGPGTGYASVGTCKAGDVFSAPDTDGWVPVLIDGQVRWISAKYAKVEG